MINARSVMVSVVGAAVSLAPWACAQDGKPSGPVVIQELALRPPPSLASLSFPADSIAPSAQTPDLSRYRDFRLGMTLAAVAKQTDPGPPDLTVVHEHPVLIQEMNWRLPPALDSSSAADPVESIVFSFYNGEL